MENFKKTITAIIVGAGHRSILYASFALKNPEKFKIIGVVDPNEHRVNETAKMFDIPAENRFSSVDELIKREKFADCIINGTMDQLHIETSIPLLKLGYHMLLEKPICSNENDLMLLLDVATLNKVKVVVCHVLRHAPFYAEIKQKLLDSEIGEIINIQTTEHVSYHHMDVSYVRGKHNNDKISTMLMAKCCHDLDIITWLAKDSRPIKVSSFGSRQQFKIENAPKNSGTRCLLDCPKDVEENCLYSAKKLYLEHPDRWSFYVWHTLEHKKDLTIKDKEEALKNHLPHGRCIYKCDNNVVDRQSVLIEFESGITATHNMIGGSPTARRNIHVIGTKGEIVGAMEDNSFVIRKIDPLAPNGEYTEETFKLNTTTDMHGGGDLRLVNDFVDLLLGKKPSISTTNLEDSIYGHLIGFYADKARINNTVEQIKNINLGGRI